MRDYFIYEIIMFLIFMVAIVIIFTNTDITTQSSYIQNLEEKLNTYERSYDEFCLEDSLRQSDANERI